MDEKRLVAMRRTSALLVIVITVFCSCSLGSSEFHYISMTKTYEEAKTYCREMYNDLATVRSSEDMTVLISAALQSARAWIGLEAEIVLTWYWSQSDQNTNYSNWKKNETKTDGQACAAMDKSGKWLSNKCTKERSFVCHGKDGTSLITTCKTWRDAQHHCRNLSSDLVTIHSTQKNNAVKSLIKSKKVWIGLFGDHWKWSDGSKSSFRFWKPNQPNNLEQQKCVAAIFKDEGKWNNLECQNKFSFFCQGAQKSISSSTSSQTTQESTTLYQLTTTLPHNPSQGVTVTSHATVAATKNSANATTPAPTAASELTTQNTTEFVSHPTSTEFSNATKEMSTATTAQLTPTTTTSTLMPTANSHSLHPVNLILIQKNMTWLEAMSYCREHHIDLVHITTQYIQDKVAEKARNATSPHVWLGLRYTCNLKFWFWIQSTSGCYQNWAPGHGPKGENECGVSGAIEATGRQQWVGLPERQELNFICYACAE